MGWFQGRMEFGPRALGNRSILGDPSSEKTQSVMNLKIKRRESFRPFAPSVLRGEPIVCTPEDAYRCFMWTEMDYLVLGDFLLDKRDQKPLANRI